MEKTLKTDNKLPRLIGFPEITYRVSNYPSLSHMIVNNALVIRPFYSDNRNDEAAHPLVIYVIGGGYTVCPPYSHMSTLYALAQHGYVVASITYSTVNEVPFPAQIEDVKCAVRFFRANAAKFGIDPEKIAIMGESAGGNLAALAGITANTGLFKTDDNPDVSEKVNAVVDIYGALDMSEIVANNPARYSAARMMMFQMDEKLEQASNPLNYDLKNSPPFLLLHGTQDKIVPCTDSKRFYEKLIKSGVEAKLIWVQDGGHSSIHFCQKEVNDEILSFLDSHLSI